jgi:hypothetical protein
MGWAIVWAFFDDLVTKHPVTLPSMALHHF